LSLSVLLKLLYRVLTLGPATGYGDSRRPPYSAFDVPPKLFVVPGMPPPPSCQMHEPSELVVVLKIG
jgi:hypothetical protein